MGWDGKYNDYDMITFLLRSGNDFFANQKSVVFLNNFGTYMTSRIRVCQHSGGISFLRVRHDRNHIFSSSIEFAFCQRIRYSGQLRFHMYACNCLTT